MSEQKKTKNGKLKSALRDNLRKRKAQSRKLKTADSFSVKLRQRDIDDKLLFDEKNSGEE